MDNSQWNIFCQLSQIHNDVMAGKVGQREFNDFVIENREQLAFPQAVEVLMTNIRVLDLDFIKANEQLCKTSFELLMKVGIDKLDFRESVRASSFIETMKIYNTAN